MSDAKEIIISVPAELTIKCQGLAMDMGGSVLKFVYRTKEDYDDAVSESDSYGRLRLVSFARNAMQEGLIYIKQRVYIKDAKDNDELPILNTTGIGCTQYGKLIQETLNVRLRSQTELDCFVKAFLYLTTHQPRSLLLEPFEDEALTEPIDMAKSQLSTLATIEAKNLTTGLDFDIAKEMDKTLLLSTGRSDVEDTNHLTLRMAEPEMFPCVLVMCGSGVAFTKIEKDGSFRMIDGSGRGGKAFNGIGKLLTGCKTFDELVDLASTGDAYKVDQYTTDLIESQHAVTDDDESAYKLITKAKPGLVYNFGKVASESSQFSPADLARSWLNYVILDLIQLVHTVCLLHGVSRLFFCGGFCNRQFVRQIITSELARRNMIGRVLTQRSEVVVFDFIKPGQYLGALGCMIASLNESSEN